MRKTTVEDVAEAGVVGAGGAGFPTHVKLAAEADTVLVNAAGWCQSFNSDWRRFASDRREW